MAFKPRFRATKKTVRECGPTRPFKLLIPEVISLQVYFLRRPPAKSRGRYIKSLYRVRSLGITHARFYSGFHLHYSNRRDKAAARVVIERINSIPYRIITLINVAIPRFTDIANILGPGRAILEIGHKPLDRFCRAFKCSLPTCCIVSVSYICPENIL